MDQPGPRIALMDVLDRVLDKGIVIDAGIRVTVIGIDLMTVDAMITVASIQTYLQLSEDHRAYDLGLIGGGPRRTTEQELERLTEPKRVWGAEEERVEPSPALGAAPPPDRGLPLAAFQDEELTTDPTTEAEPPEQQT